MKYLLDTHTLLWALYDSNKLSDNAKNTLRGSDCCVSIASLWEMAIKASLKREDKRLEFNESIQEIAETCAAQGIGIIPITDLPSISERRLKTSAITPVVSPRARSLE